jgi:hypothetical protein
MKSSEFIGSDQNPNVHHKQEMVSWRGGISDALEWPLTPPGAQGHDGADGVSLDWLLAQPELPALAQVIPAAALYRLLQREGLEESMELVEWIRGPQLIRVFDHDLWRPAVHGDVQQLGMSEDAGKVAIIDSDRFLEWVSVWSEMSPEFAGERFLELDEETMILLCRSMFEIVPEGHENGAILSDDWFQTVDRRFHLRFKSASLESQERASLFLSSLYGARMDLAGRVFAYAAMLVEAETHEDAMRWRSGRLADDGFVSSEEALAVVRAQDLSRWTDAFIARSQEVESRVAAAEERCVEADGRTELDPDLIAAVGAVLAGNRDASVPNLLAHSYGETDDVDAADTPSPFADLKIGEGGAETLTRLCLLKWAQHDQHVLFAANDARCQVSAGSSEASPAVAPSPGDMPQLQSLIVDRVLESLAELAPERQQGIRARLARQCNVIASLLPDPASESAQRRAAAAVRGLINLGLEWLAEGRPDPGVWSTLNGGDAAKTGGRSQTTPNVQDGYAFEARALELLLTLGVEVVVQAGRDLLGALATVAAKGIDAVVLRLDQAQRSDQPKYESLYRQSQFSSLQEHIFSAEAVLDTEVAVLARCLLRRVPVCPVVLGDHSVAQSKESATTSGQVLQGRKPFETPAEYSRCWRAACSWSTPNTKAEHEKANLH